MFLEKEMIGTCVVETALLWSEFTVVTSNFWAPFFQTYFKTLCRVGFGANPKHYPGHSAIDTFTTDN